jgi:hypothetical protein
MTSEVDTRALSRRFHAQAQRERDAGLEGVAKTYQEIADALDQLHDERAQERAARERAEAEAQKWKEVAAREWERARKAENMLAQARQP